MSGFVLNTCSDCAAGPSAEQHRNNLIGGAHRFRSPLQARAEQHAREVGIDFDEAGHLYTLPVTDVFGKVAGRGTPVPSVTGILAAEGFLDHTYCDALARDRGSRVHAAVHYLCENDLDRSSLGDDVAPYVASAEAFLHDMQVEVVMVEAIVYSILYGYAGKPDFIGYLRHRRRLAGIDWKTGVPPPATALQLAAYAGAWLEMTGEAVVDRMAVHLTPKATKPYRIVEYTDRGDLAVFRGAAASHNWKRRHLNVRAA
jgi:hypothetical protein